MNRRLNIYGDYFTGDPFSMQLTPDKIAEGKHIAEIEQRIRSLRPLLYDFAVIDLIKADGSSDVPSFFQTTRDRAYNPCPEERYLFNVEVGIRETDGTRKGTWVYRKERLSCDEAVRLFYEICVERKMPDLREWNRNDRFFSEEKTAKERRDAQKIKRCVNIFSQCVTEKVSETLHDALLWEALETLCYDKLFEYSQIFSGLCQEYNSYTELNRLIAYQSHDAVLATAKADLLYQGKLGEPDLKGAYDLYVHAARTGSLRAGFMVAKALRDGWLGAPDAERYEGIVRSIYDFYIQKEPLHLFALPEVILELARIEEKHGNIEKVIEYCLKWKEMALMNASNSCYPSETDGQIVLELYGLTEFDPDDIDLLDLFYVLRSPCKTTIFLECGTEIKVEAVTYEGETIVKCGENYFRTVTDFFKQYRLNGKRISAYADEILYIEMEENDE